MKKQPKLSDWIDGSVKPTIKGWYQRKYLQAWMINMPDYWDGKHWYIGVDGKATERAEVMKPWRGLAQDPAKVKE